MIRNSENKVCAILDAKYKHLENNNVDREDYFQVLAYMYRFKCSKGLLVYPYNEVDASPDSERYLRDHARKDVFLIYGFKIPKNENENENAKDLSNSFVKSEKEKYKAFSADMWKSEEKLFEYVQSRTSDRSSGKAVLE